MPAQSDIVEVETQLLNELGGYIAANVADASISFVARNISTQSKAELQRDASDLPTLRLNLDFDRAWATVNQALHEAKLDVTDVDRSAGVFYVTVTDQMLNQEEKPSIWTRWFRSEHKRKVTILMEPKTPGFDLTVFDDNGQRRRIGCCGADPHHDSRVRDIAADRAAPHPSRAGAGRGPRVARQRQSRQRYGGFSRRRPPAGRLRFHAAADAHAPRTAGSAARRPVGDPGHARTQRSHAGRRGVGATPSLAGLSVAWDAPRRERLGRSRPAPVQFADELPDRRYFRHTGAGSARCARAYAVRIRRRRCAHRRVDRPRTHHAVRERGVRALQCAAGRGESRSRDVVERHLSAAAQTPHCERTGSSL